MNSEREQWDRKYREGSHSDLTPDPFLLDAYKNFVLPLLDESSGRTALDLAGGAGRHALWLAERGWHVTLVDVSPVGIELACKNAQDRGVSIDARVADLVTMPLPQAQYDLVLIFFYLERSLFPAIQQLLKPGGLLIYKTYTHEHPKLSGGKGPTHPMHLLESNELLHAFANPLAKLRVLHYRESIQNKGTAELVAQNSV